MRFGDEDFFKEHGKIWKQRSLKLFLTKQCLANYRLAKQKNLDPELIRELWLLTEVMAKREWGEDTVLDDFSDEFYVTVVNKNRKDKI